LRGRAGGKAAHHEADEAFNILRAPPASRLSQVAPLGFLDGSLTRLYFGGAELRFA